MALLFRDEILLQDNNNYLTFKKIISCDSRRLKDGGDFVFFDPGIKMGETFLSILNNLLNALKQLKENKRFEEIVPLG